MWIYLKRRGKKGKKIVLVEKKVNEKLSAALELDVQIRGTFIEKYNLRVSATL